MLTCLRVRQLAIIEELEVEFGPGLNVVSGETGAGKSILIDALALVLGARGARELVRTGAERADVEALFEQGEAQRVLRRSLLATGRSRAYVDGSLATVQHLGELARGLVDISSQHEHHTLVDAATHLGFLDAYAGLAEERAAMSAAHAALVAAQAAVREGEARARSRVEREDLLRYQLGEVDAFGPKAGEGIALEEERERLRHAARLAGSAATAERELWGRDAALCHQLGRLVNDLQAAARIDPALDGPARALESARTEMEEAARELGLYARGLEADPRRLSQVEERLFEARRLSRKYGGDEAALLQWREAAVEELAELEAVEERLERLEKARDAALGRAAALAGELSDRRRAAAAALGDAITGELASLGMGGARVEVDVASLAGGQGELAVEVGGARAHLSPTGHDRVEFLIAPNPGEEPRPLGKVASGGELSRSLLAVKRVLSGIGPDGGSRGLYVFDEVDSGVGGGVAEVIGRKLKEVAAHHQVLCITHLPQIAVYADQHFRVRKEVAGGRTFSAIERLDERGRIEELSRMMGGLEVTDTTRLAATELLEGARAAT